MTKYKLVCFDVDGTLVDNVEFSWELLHDHFNIDKAKRKQAMEKYFKGEMWTSNLGILIVTMI